MASKRMKNRVYWAYVKADTYHHGSHQHLALKDLYRAIFRDGLNLTDATITDAYGDGLEEIESQHGPAGLRNVHNRDLWPTRERLAMANG